MIRGIVGEWCPLGKQRPPFAEPLPAGDRRTMRTIVECSLPSDPPALPIESRARSQSQRYQATSQLPRNRHSRQANRLTGASIVNPGSEVCALADEIKTIKNKTHKRSMPRHPPKLRASILNSHLPDLQLAFEWSTGYCTIANDDFQLLVMERNMARRLLFVVCISAVVGVPGLSQAQTREILLNQVDPQGAMLALAIVPRANELPSWIRPDNLNNVSVEAKQPSAATSNVSRQSAGSSIKSQFAIKPDAPGSGQRNLKLGAASRSSVEISRTDDALAAVPACEASPTPQAACRITDLGKAIILAATSHARGKLTSLTSLIAARGLVLDDRSTKRVVVTVDENNALQHVDFVGLVRSKTEKLDAPDASSAFVVRLGRAGNFSIIERRRDAAIDPSKIKFAGEE